MDLEYREFLKDLLYKVYTSFELGKLQVLCFDLGVDWEELEGEGVGSKTFSLVSHLGSRGQLADLLALLRREKPDVDWPNLPSTYKLTPSSGSYQVKGGSVSLFKGGSVPDATLQEILHLHYPEVWADIVQRGLYKKSLNLSDLLKKIREYFSESEFRDICFTLEIDHGQLGGEHYYDKARELISHCKRKGKLNHLIKLCKEQRPHIIWDYK